jgi:ribosome-associated heat shock protein Hsp15
MYTPFEWNSIFYNQVVAFENKTLTDNTLPLQRLDAWLWAARFFKSRKLSNHAVSAGHVRLNGSKPKPGKQVRAGDQLIIKTNHQEFHIVIEKLSARRLGPQPARELYAEHEWSKANRANENLLRKSSMLGVRYARGKPNPRERKRMRELKQQTEG